KQYGDEVCRKVARSMREGIDVVEQLTRELDIPGVVKRVPAYYFTERKNGLEIIKLEYDTIRRLELFDVADSGVPLPFETLSGFQIPGQLQFESLNYLNALAKAIEGNGSEILENTHVMSYDDGDQPSVVTLFGTVRARSIVLATHMPIGRNILQQMALTPTR